MAARQLSQEELDQAWSNLERYTARGSAGGGGAASRQNECTVRGPFYSVPTSREAGCPPGHLLSLTPGVDPEVGSLPCCFDQQSAMATVRTSAPPMVAGGGGGGGTVLPSFLTSGRRSPPPLERMSSAVPPPAPASASVPGRTSRGPVPPPFVPQAPPRERKVSAPQRVTRDQLLARYRGNASGRCASVPGQTLWSPFFGCLPGQQEFVDEDQPCCRPSPPLTGAWASIAYDTLQTTASTAQVYETVDRIGKLIDVLRDQAELIYFLNLIPTQEGAAASASSSSASGSVHRDYFTRQEAIQLYNASKTRFQLDRGEMRLFISNALGVPIPPTTSIVPFLTRHAKNVAELIPKIGSLDYVRALFHLVNLKMETIAKIKAQITILSASPQLDPKLKADLVGLRSNLDLLQTILNMFHGSLLEMANRPAPLAMSRTVSRAAPPPLPAYTTPASASGSVRLPRAVPPSLVAASAFRQPPPLPPLQPAPFEGGGGGGGGAPPPAARIPPPIMSSEDATAAILASIAASSSGSLKRSRAAASAASAAATAATAAKRAREEKEDAGEDAASDAARVEVKIDTRACDDRIRALATRADKPIQMKEWQIEVIRALLRQRGVIAWHSFGSGKTLTAVMAIYCLLGRVGPGAIHEAYIVANPTTFPAWMAEFKRAGIPPNFEIMVLQESAKMPAPLSMEQIARGVKRVIIFGIRLLHNLVQKNRLNCKNIFLIVDEAHHQKGEQPKAGSAKITGIQAASILNCSRRANASKVLVMTGDPIPNNPADIINLIAMVDGKRPIEKKEFNHMLDRHAQGNVAPLNDYLRCKISYHSQNYRSPIPPSIEDGYPIVIEHPEVKVTMSDPYLVAYDTVERKEFADFAAQHRGGLREDIDPYIFYTGLRQASNNITLPGVDNPKVAAISKIFNDTLRERYAEAVLEGKDPEFGKDKQKIVIYSGFITSGLGPVADELDKAAGLPPVAIVHGVGTRKNKETDEIEEYDTWVRAGAGTNTVNNRRYVEINSKTPRLERELAIARYNIVEGENKILYDPERKIVQVVPYDYVLPERKARAPRKPTKKQLAAATAAAASSASAGVAGGAGTAESKRARKPRKPRVIREPELFDAVNIILLGPAGSEGINLKRTRVEIILEPDWNRSRLDQAVARGARMTSHADLPMNERKIDVYYIVLVKPPDWQERLDNYYALLNQPRPQGDSGYITMSTKPLIREGVDMVMFNKTVGKQIEADNFVTIAEANSIGRNASCRAG